RRTRITAASRPRSVTGTPAWRRSTRRSSRRGTSEATPLTRLPRAGTLPGRTVHWTAMPGDHGPAPFLRGRGAAAPRRRIPLRAPPDRRRRAGRGGPRAGDLPPRLPRLGTVHARNLREELAVYHLPERVP